MLWWKSNRLTFNFQVKSYGVCSFVNMIQLSADDALCFENVVSLNVVPCVFIAIVSSRLVCSTLFALHSNISIAQNAPKRSNLMITLLTRQCHCRPCDPNCASELTWNKLQYLVNNCTMHLVIHTGRISVILHQLCLHRVSPYLEVDSSDLHVADYTPTAS